MTINTFESPEKAAEAFAADLARWIEEEEEYFVALSGGSTPQLLFRHLAEKFRERIDWQKVHLFWGDERCVPPDHEESNYGTARRLLLDRIDIPEENIHRVHGEALPEKEALRYSLEIRQNLPFENDLPSFDLVLLGLGEDGHTASIFPDQMELLDADGICAVATHPESGQKRITLVGKVINNARKVAFLATGKGKAEKVRQILHKKEGWEKLPAAHILPSQGDLYWYLDREAAGRN